MLQDWGKDTDLVEVHANKHEKPISSTCINPS